jgi:serine/threonine protein kinase
MSDSPHYKPDEIAPLLRLGLDDDHFPASSALEAGMESEETMQCATEYESPPAGRTTRSHGWQPPSVEHLQQMLPQYSVTCLIARGGMGAVYKGTQKALKRSVAIKVLPSEIEDGDLQFSERFKHEAQAMARLTHPSIVAVFDAGESPEGLLYFVMEFVEGTNVAQLIASEGLLEPRRAIDITVAVCEALAFAHEEGIVHRDIKPSNIMIDKRGRVKVADFGLAKSVHVDATLLTGSNIAMGTPDFIAPEAMIPGMKIDQRADLYAVGVMLYQMLTGKIPRGRFELPSGVVPQMDQRFDPIVHKAMQTDRDKRYSTATEIKTDVEGVRRETTKTGGFQPPVPTITEASNRRPLKKPLFVSGAILALTAGAFFALKKSQPETNGVTPKTLDTQSAALHLWASRDQLPAGQRGVSWENGAIKLEKTSLRYAAARYGDVIVRVRILADPQSLSNITVRSPTWRNEGDRGAGCFCFLSRDGTKLELSVRASDKRGAYQSWPLPRLYAATDWIQLELKAQGDTLSASVDGQLLGTLRDSTLTEPGLIELSSKGVGYFKDVEVVPLDSQSASLHLWANTNQLPLRRGVIWENNAIRVEKTLLRYDAAKYRDVILRAKVFAAPGTQSQLMVRSRDTVKGEELPDGYYFNIDVRNPGGAALRSRHDGNTVLVKSWQLPHPYAATDWIQVELRMHGDALSAFLDGQLLGTIQDSTQPERGYIALRSDAVGYFKDVEVVPLDGLPESGALKLAEQAAAVIPYPIGQWVDAWPLMKGLADQAGSPNKDYQERDGWVEPAQKGFHIADQRLAGRNLALRATFRFASNANIFGQLVARHLDTDHNYRVRLKYDYTAARLLLHDSALIKEDTLMELPLQKPLSKDDVYTLQLAVIGQRLIGWCNGKIIADITDAHLTDGGAGIMTGEAFRDFQVMNLEGLPRTEALKLLGFLEASSAQVSALPADAVSWHDWLAENEKAGTLPQHLAKEAGGWRITQANAGEGRYSRFNASFGSTDLKDAALRVTYLPSEKEPGRQVHLSVREAADQQGWRVQTKGMEGQWVMNVVKQGTSSELAAFPPITKTAPPSEPRTVELRMVGDTLSFFYNGALVGSTKDATPGTGQVGFNSPLGILIQKVEWADLSGLPPANGE